jgi:hypothetical protein
MNTLSDADLEVVSAFVDGEVVAAPSLTKALSTDEGREYLIDLLQVRQAVGEARSQLRTYLPLTPNARPRSRGLLAWSIPAVLAAAFAAGYLVRSNHESTRGDGNRAFLASDGIGTPVEPSAPAPSVVIKLEPGVSWFERTQVR